VEKVEIYQELARYKEVIEIPSLDVGKERAQ